MAFTPRYPDAEQSGQIGRCIQCSALITGVPIHDGWGTCSTHRRRMQMGYIGSVPCPNGPKTMAMAYRRADEQRRLEGALRERFAEHRSGLPWSGAIEAWPYLATMRLDTITGYVFA